MVLEIFKIALCLRDRHVFMSQPLEILNVFNDLILKPNFLKNKKMKHHFLVENPKTENSTFPYKTSSSEANVKKKECGVYNGPITKNKILAVTSLFFTKFCFSVKITCKNLI